MSSFRDFSYYTDTESEIALLDPVLAFRDRMYRTHGLSPPKSIRENILDASNSFGASHVSRMGITIVKSKRKLLGVAEAAGPIAEKHGMNLNVIRWEDMSFREKMEVCAMNYFLQPVPRADGGLRNELLSATSYGASNIFQHSVVFGNMTLAVHLGRCRTVVGHHFDFGMKSDCCQRGWRLRFCCHSASAVANAAPEIRR